MIAAERLHAAIEFVEWLRKSVHERAIPPSNRARAAASCFAIAQSHHHSIVLLVEHSQCASAFALVRCGFEAYLRGEWLSRCARDADVRRFLKGKEPPPVETMLRALEAEEAFSEKVLSNIKRRHWRALCAYTHTGGLHVQRWNTPTAVESAYTALEVEGAVQFAELVGSMSVIGLAHLAQDDELAISVLGEVKRRADEA